MRLTGTRLLVTILVLGVTASGLVAQEDGDGELRGDVVSAATGDPVAGAWIGLEGWASGTYSWRDGHFRLPEVPKGPARYEVQALGYHPLTVSLDPAADGLIELEPDSALQAGLVFLFDHLENRRNGGRVFDRQALAFSGAWDLTEFLMIHGARRVRKFCLDERTDPGMAVAPPEGFYLLELHGSKVRLYTEEFLEQTAREDPETIREIIRLRQPIC